MAEDAVEQIDGAEAIEEKLEGAQDHLDQAELLQNEAKEEAEDLVRSAIDFEATISSEYHSSSNAVSIRLIPKSISDSIADGDHAPTVSSLRIVFGGPIDRSTSKSQRRRIKNIKGLTADIEEEYDEGAPVEEVLDQSMLIGLNRQEAENELEKLRTKGEVYEPKEGHLRTT